ncbi:S-protein homolog 1-like [Alnus glutinosa]|uniref:S-protein homolog 1-like n=1 Tax=Alnus glutinosa TaxID=3517 RepID=UPI002D78E118|nr:S-protein homolog 1-like [Alnus glutinosa]
MDVQKMSYLAVLLLVLALCMSQPLIANAGKFVVHVENGLKNDILQAHCKSGDDDLGLQYISVNKEFQWSFGINFWQSTLFFCNMSWVGGQRTFDVFWVNNIFFRKYCPHYDCLWRAQEDGIYLFNYESSEYEFQYKWEPRQI